MMHDESVSSLMMPITISFLHPKTRAATALRVWPNGTIESLVHDRWFPDASVDAIDSIKTIAAFMALVGNHATQESDKR